jgi:hypothetical protein
VTGFKIETQRGAPLRVGGREIVPEARVWSLHIKQLSLNEQGAQGGGFHWSWSQPTALIEQGADETRRVPVRDFNLQLEWSLLLAAIVLPLLLIIFTRWARARGTSLRSA